MEALLLRKWIDDVTQSDVSPWYACACVCVCTFGCCVWHNNSKFKPKVFHLYRKMAVVIVMALRCSQVPYNLIKLNERKQSEINKLKCAQMIYIYKASL